MKSKKILFAFLIILAVLGSAAAVGYFIFSRPEPEVVFRANLTEAQKMLEIMRRAEIAYAQSSSRYQTISAKKDAGKKVVYSDGWREMKLPEIDRGAGFDYECLTEEGACQAIEIGEKGASGNGVRIDIETGIYECLGVYKPVTTEGFDGELVTVACQS